MKKTIKYLLLISTIVLIVGLLPYRPAWIIDREDYLLVSPQACTCCPHMVINQGTLNIPERFKNNYGGITTHEFNIENKTGIGSHISAGEYYHYYIKGAVVEIDSINCGEYYEYAPSINVQEVYLAEYIPTIWASQNTTLLLIYIANILFVLPALIIKALVDYFVDKKRKKNV